MKVIEKLKDKDFVNDYRICDKLNELIDSHNALERKLEKIIKAVDWDKLIGKKVETNI